MAKRANKVGRVEEGSGNVLVDLGLSDAAELTTKVQLAVAINQQIFHSLRQPRVCRCYGIRPSRKAIDYQDEIPIALRDRACTRTVFAVPLH
jgi:predicted XRE-type DNA-binding protein